jgi:photosystem II stability/assembly factor-like uncharacterized protein
MQRSLGRLPVLLAVVIASGLAEGTEPQLTAKTLSGLELRNIGPALMSGRIADIAIHPQRQSTWYVAVGSGGVWRTTNAGTTWEPLFDEQSSYSVGCVTIDPSNPKTIWVGAGENVGGRHVGYGDGVYKSLDGGTTWANMGLERSEHIARIVLDPRDTNVVWVAAQGPLWSAGGDRGLYRSTDGGASWQLKLSGNEFTGVTDVVLDPRDPDTLVAATHQRLRTVAAVINGGPGSGLHKSTDGGATWRRLGKGLPEDDMGRIGLAISPQQPDVLYATIELANRTGGFWRSTDRGETWEKRSDTVAGGTGPHYYQELVPSPHAFDRVYMMDVRLGVTDDGGATFRRVPGENKHVDHHALAFDPDDPAYLLAGTDGGLYESWDLGATWRFAANLPVTQFYKVAVDSDEPFYTVYGGTQDNSTQGGPSRTDSVSGIRNSDWFITVFADGHQPAVDPTNPDIVYSEWQQGNLVRFDRKTGEIVYIQPQPEPGDPGERWNWDAPILISPHAPSRLYYGSQRVWRSDDHGDSWRPVSGDLSRGVDRLLMPLMGRVWSHDSSWDFGAMSQYGTVTSLAESPLVEGLLYAGVDDGLLHVSEDGGGQWRRIDRIPGAPDGAFVNDLKADLHDPDTVYAALDHHKTGDFSPYLFRSTDRGRTWSSMVGDLPDRHLVWRLVQDHVEPRLFFVGTEFGIFCSLDGGRHWVELQGGMPTIPVRDLAVQRRENDLVAASFGRGFFILDDYTPLRELSAATLDQEMVLFPVRDTWWYVPRRPLGSDGKAQQGDAYFMAPNPPHGAVFTYYLRDGLSTRKAARREREQELEAEGADTPHPGWDELRREQREPDPAIVLTVRDADGGVVRRLQGPTTAGFHRVAWDLRFPSSRAWRPAGEQEDDWDRDSGLLAAPGTYTVSLASRVEGRTAELGAPRTFEVRRLREGTLPGTEPEETVEYARQVAELRRAVTGAEQAIAEALDRTEAMRDALLSATAGDTSLDEAVQALRVRLLDLKVRLSGDELRRDMGVSDPPSIARRLRVARMGVRSSTYGPTPTHRRSFEIAAAQYAALHVELEQALEVELSALEGRLEAAGVPWTPGRPAPPPGG